PDRPQDRGHRAVHLGPGRAGTRQAREPAIPGGRAVTEGADHSMTPHPIPPHVGGGERCCKKCPVIHGLALRNVSIRRPTSARRAWKLARFTTSRAEEMATSSTG